MDYCPKCGKPLPEGAQFCAFCGTPVQASASTAQAVGAATTTHRSGIDALSKDFGARAYWAKRLVAFIIDAIIIGVAIALISAVVAFSTFFAGPLTVDRFFSSFWVAGLSSVLSGLILVLYFVIAETTYGTTVGKSILGLKVTADDGRMPSLGTSFIRNISKIYWVLLLLDVVVGLALEVDYKKKFSDRYANTLVVLR